MEMQIDETCAGIIKKAFEWSDIDKDGKISREDIKISSGLSSEKEAEQVFNAIKSAAGSSEGPFITFEEFSKGILDFPFLLEHFKDEFFYTPVQEPNDSMDDSYSNDSHEKILSNMDFVVKGLQETVKHLNQALKISSFSFMPDNTEDLLEVLRQLLEKIRKCYKASDKKELVVVNAAIELYLLVRDLNSFHLEKEGQQLKRYEDAKASICVLREQCELLAEKNDKLLTEMVKMENIEREWKEKQMEEIKQKISLQNELKRAESNESTIKKHLETIESSIFSKEKAIAQLEKELRRLTSLKTLSEMQDALKNLSDTEISDQKPRLSTPLILTNRPGSVRPGSSRPNLKSDFLSMCLSSNKDLLILKDKQIDNLVTETDRLKSIIQTLTLTNKDLLEKLASPSTQHPKTFVPTPIHNKQLSLFDEFLLSQEDALSDFDAKDLLESNNVGIQCMIKGKSVKTQTIFEAGEKRSCEQCLIY